MSCEDFPCCGHEMGCCPDFLDGIQQNMICVCGAVVPITSESSLCWGCLHEENLLWGEDGFTTGLER